MAHKHESRLSELIGEARQMNIEVRTEKLLREVGYRARSGRCRVNGQELILIDRDAPIRDQIEFLSTEMAPGQSQSPHPARNPNNPTQGCSPLNHRPAESFAFYLMDANLLCGFDAEGKFVLA